MKKILVIISLASITTFGLFAFMAFLINSDQVGFTEPQNYPVVQVYQTPKDSKPIEKEKPNLDPPVPPPPMPRDTISPEVSNEGTDYVYQPILNVNVGESPIDFLQGTPDNEARPVVRVNPKYPMIAARNGIEGWVVLAFDINAIGEVINIKIIDSQPKRTFDKAAKQALRKWKYKAKSIDGKQVQQENLTVQLDFTIDQQS